MSFYRKILCLAFYRSLALHSTADRVFQISGFVFVSRRIFYLGSFRLMTFLYFAPASSQRPSSQRPSSQYRFYSASSF